MVMRLTERVERTIVQAVMEGTPGIYGAAIDVYDLIKTAKIVMVTIAHMLAERVVVHVVRMLDWAAL